LALRAMFLRLAGGAHARRSPYSPPKKHHSNLAFAISATLAYTERASVFPYCKRLPTRQMPRWSTIPRGLRNGLFLPFSVFTFSCLFVQITSYSNTMFLPTGYATRPFLKCEIPVQMFHISIVNNTIIAVAILNSNQFAGLIRHGFLFCEVVSVCFQAEHFL